VPSQGISFVRLVSMENLIFMIIALFFCMPVLERSRTFRNGEDLLPVTGEDAKQGGTQGDGQGSAQERLGTLGSSRARLVFDGAVVLALFFLCSMYIMSGTYNPFIYFRF